ncbi:MAG: hypothetical protein AWU59_833 [Methanolobus sp. T82-4]|nr:MAG: hypothetical protein AWU59_833 [Methanolobus sp. T82-4]
MLLSLRDGPKDIETILRSLRTTRQALIPQIRVLEDHYLIDQLDNAYELTTVGRLLIDEMTILLGTIEVFDGNTDYWGTHNLDFIPPYLLKRIKELGKCEQVNLSLTESYQLNQDVVKTTFMSESFFVITSFFHPDYPRVFHEMVQGGVNLYIIVSGNVLEKMQKDHKEHFQGLIDSEHFNLYVYPEKMGLQVIAHNDHHLLMRLLTSEGEIDINHVLCSDPGALKWAKELFDHYRKDATPVNEL